jgi:hypothetical protein
MSLICNIRRLLGLTKTHRQMVDASYGGTFMMKSGNEAWTLFENVRDNSVHHASTSCRPPTPNAPKTGDLFEIGKPNNSMNPYMAILSRKMDQMMVAMVAYPHMTTKHDPCSFCFSPMHRDTDRLCPRQFFDIPNEHVNAAFSRPSNDPYLNSYNPG